MAVQFWAGCRVYRHVLVGHDGAFDVTDIIQPLTVVRVNQKTITVRTDEGNTFRIPPQDIRGKWTD